MSRDEFKLKIDELHIKEVGFDEMRVKSSSLDELHVKSNALDEMHVKNSELDEMHIKERAVPYEEYFAPMDITKIQKKRRLAFARFFEEIMLYIFDLIGTYIEYEGIADYNVIKSELSKEYTKLVKGEYEDKELEIFNDYFVFDEDVEFYIKQFTTDFARTTQKNQSNIWYTSEDRAKFIAENEANTILNYGEYKEAVGRGFTRKRWYSFLDNRVRDTHAIANGQTIPIDEYFHVGNALLFFPKDCITPKSTGMLHPEEIVNCRCSMRYVR